MFLVSPVIMPSVADATKTYLKRNDVPEPGSGGCKDLLEMISKAGYVKLIAQKKADAKLRILEGDIMLQLDTIFSNRLSRFMELYGSSEVVEATKYGIALNGYWANVRDEITRITAEMAANCQSDDILKPILENMAIKIGWLRLGFNPSKEGRLNVQTLPPLLTPFVFSSLVPVWNTIGMKKPVNEQMFFGDTVAEASRSN